MALNPSLLESVAQASVFNQLKAEFSGDIPSDLGASEKKVVEDGWTRIANAVAKAMPDIISHFIANTQVATTVSTIVATTGTAAAQTGTGTGTGTGIIS